MSALAVIHIAKKRLGLDDETYRAVLLRVTGKASSKEMTEAERGAVIVEMRRLGFVDDRAQRGKRDRAPGAARAAGADQPRRSSRLEGKYAPKLQALWLSGWHLGIIRNREDSALLAFVKRQTGLDHTRFLHYPDDARKAIEALKAMLARPIEKGGADVDWSNDHLLPDYLLTDAAKVARAMHARAESLGVFPFPFAFGPRVAAIAGKPVKTFTGADWVRVHQHFGARIRAALANKSGE